MNAYRDFVILKLKKMKTSLVVIICLILVGSNTIAQNENWVNIRFGDNPDQNVRTFSDENDGFYDIQNSGILDVSPGADTLYISVDRSDPGIYYTDGTFVYGGPFGIEWISPTFGYLLFNSNKHYDIIASWSVLSQKLRYMVVEEDLSFSNSDTLNLFSTAAQNEIIINSYDHNGAQLNGICFREIFLIKQLTVGSFVFNTFIHLDGQTFLSEVSSEYQIVCTSLYFDVEDETHWIEFPGFYGIDQSITLENDPSKFQFINFQVYLPDIAMHEFYAGFMRGYTHKDYWDNESGLLAGYLPNISTGDYWNARLYVSNEEYDSIRFYVAPIFENSIYVGCMTPGIEVYDVDSIAAFSSLSPPYNVFRCHDGDTLKFGETPITMTTIWQNNDPVLSIGAVFRNMGQLGEMIDYYFGYPSYQIFDNNGNLINSGSGFFIDYPLNENGIYKVIVSHDNSLFFNGEGITKATSYFNTELEDATPPWISPVQFRNMQNKSIFWVGAGDELKVLFNAKDLNDVDYDTVFLGACHFEYQSVVNDSTKVFIKDHNDNMWIEVEVDMLHEDSVHGISYLSDLSDYTNVDSIALDLKIQIVDYSGNKSVYELLPAVLIGGSPPVSLEEASSQDEEIHIEVFPNPAMDEISVKYKFVNYLSRELRIFDLQGNMVEKIVLTDKSGTVRLDISSYLAGAYILVHQSERGQLETVTFVKK